MISILLGIPIFLVFAIIVYLIYELIYKQKRIYDTLKEQNISGDPFKPIVGHLPRFCPNNQILHVRRLRQEKYGNIYLLQFGHRVNLVLIDTDYIGDVLRRCAKCYKKPELFRIVFGPLIGGTDNLFASEGEQHKRLRKMLNPAFQHSKLQSMFTIMIEQTTKQVDELVTEMTENNIDEFDLQRVFYKLTLLVVVVSVFGQEIFETKSHGVEDLCDAYTNAIKAIEYRSAHMINQISFVRNLPLWKKDIVTTATNEIGKFVDKVIADYREKHRSLPLNDSGNILSLLLSAADQHGNGLSDADIKQEAMSFLFAGHEASGNLMTWCFYILMTHDDVYRDCQEEIDRVLQDGQPPDFCQINQLEILDAVLHETLRFYPPVPTLRRECIEEHYIGPSDQQLKIPIGTTISIDVYGVHRLPEYWHDPLVFNYKRWMGDERRKSLSNSYCFLPFSGGNRNCIGQPFALLEAKVILSMLLSRLKFELVSGQQILPDVQLTMKTKYGVMAKVTRRTIKKN